MSAEDTREPPEPAAKQTLVSERPAKGRIVRRKLSDQIQERLRAMIETGEIGPGGLMPSERDLMEQFGVGRPAVREAMQSMHVLGLITIAHGGRARVNKLSTDMAFQSMDAIARLLLSTSPENLEHLKDARRMFEIGMVSIAAAKATPQDVGDLRELIARQRSLVGEAASFIKVDMAFHRRIAAISANPIFIDLSEAMLDWLFHYHEHLLRTTGYEAMTLREHDVIAQAIAAGEPEQAVRAMGAHIDRSNDLYSHRP